MSFLSEFKYLIFIKQINLHAILKYMFIPKSLGYMFVLRAETFPSNQIFYSILIYKTDKK